MAANSSPSLHAPDEAGRVSPYLAVSAYLDGDHPTIRQKAQQLSLGCASDEQRAQACFLFVRDQIRHSWDYRQPPVTCRASEVLQYGTGYCFAKSHLLAALLRACGVPAGLCYQRLSLEGSGPPFCLHGLNAVYLQRFGWYRIDARGDRADIRTAFAPPVEHLAFAIRQPGECDLPEIWSEPLPQVIAALQGHATIEQVYRNLPDIELIGHQC